MTIGITILSIILGLDLGNELYLKKRPNLSFNKIILPSAPKIDVRANNMIFAITILDDNYQVFDYENYFEIGSYLLRKNITEMKNIDDPITKNKFILEKLNLKLVDCKNMKNEFIDYKHKKFNFKSDFEILDLNNAKCLSDYSYYDDNSKINNPLIIYGDSKSNKYSNIIFSLKKCNKKTNINCHNTNEIDKMLTKSHLAFYFIDKGIDPFLFNSPYNYFINTYFAKLDSNLNKKTDLYFKNSTITTDVGLMFQEWVQETDFTFYFYREQVTTSYSEVLFEISINSAIESEFLKRFYMKIQDLASMIGGIIKISMIIGELVSRFFNRHIMYTVILNKLFNFKIKTDDLDIIKTNKNMNNILDKNSSNNSELSKEIVIKGNKRLNRRRSAIFLNMNGQNTDMMNIPTPDRRAEKKERQRSKKKLALQEKEKLKTQKAKILIEDKMLEKIRKDFDLLEPNEVDIIKNLRVSRVLNKSDIIQRFSQFHNKANSLDNFQKESVCSNSESSIGAFEDILNHRTDNLIDNKYNSFGKQENSRDKYNLYLDKINIELKEFNNNSFNYNINNNSNDAKEESIPIERKNSSSFSMKLFGDYNKPKRVMTDSNKDFFESERLNTEKRLLITESNDKVLSLENEKLNKFYTPKNNQNLNPLLDTHENINKENLRKSNKFDENFHRIKSAILIKRRNNLYYKDDENPRNTQFGLSNKNKVVINESNNKEDIYKNFPSEEIKEDIEFLDNLKRIEEKKDDKTHSILINFPEQNFQTPLNNLDGINNKKEDSFDSNVSNKKIKKFIKRNNVSLSESDITNNTISEISSDQEISKSLYEDAFEGKNINVKKLKIIKGQLFDKYENKKKASTNKLDPSYLQIIALSFCKCKKKVKKENIFLNECQNLMGNYLDYLRIIKFLKEFDRLKKIVFSDPQLKLFSYLPKPNLKFKNEKLNLDSLYGDIFMNDKEKITNKNNNHIQYSKLFDAFVKLIGQNGKCEANKKVNKRMIAYMDKDMKHCFEDVVNNYLEQITQ
jgi:hypothetical protein